MRSRHIKTLFPGFDPQVLVRQSSGKNRYYERELQYAHDEGLNLLLLGNITLMHEKNRVTGAVISFREKKI